MTNMENSNARRLFTLFVFPVALLIIFFVFFQWQNIGERFGFQWNAVSKVSATHLNGINACNQKHKGAHVFGIMDTTNFEPFIQNNIEWITLVAWSFQDDFDSPVLNHHNGDSVIIRSSDSSWLKRIALVHSAGFKVSVKPHVWLNYASEGKWRTDVFPSNQENWELWKNNYEDYIIRYAKIAEKAEAEMFCIGTELSRLSVEKPTFWKDLIKKVRSIYSGKITYAANWDNEFEEIIFWDDLDFIGIQAYFPLAKNKNPSIEQISKGWDKHFPSIESIYNKFDRKILFTEMGYKSTANSAVRPWEWIENTSQNDSLFSAETQAFCYQAFFNKVWNKEWFAGVHLWQLRSDFVASDKDNKYDFTPQGKPAEHIIAKGFE